MVFSVFPAFFTSVLHAGAASLGLVDGIAEAASSFLKIYSGTISDRRRARKPLVVGGYALSVASRPLYALISSVAGALALRILDRIGKGLRDAPRDAIVSLSGPREELGRSFGYHRDMDTTGAILGPLAAYLILRIAPNAFSIVFLAAFTVGVLALVTLVFVADLPSYPAVQPRHLLLSFRALSPAFKLFLLSIFILSVGSLPLAVILLKAPSVGLVLADIPLFYLLYNLSYAGFSVPAGKLSDRIGAQTVICVGYLVLIIAYGVLAFANSGRWLAAGFILLGLFPALTDGVQRALVAQLTAQAVRGTGLGWLSGSSGIGVLLAGIGGGYLWQAYGPVTAFVAASVFVAIGILALLVSARLLPSKPRTDPQSDVSS
jgi:MFS family permease